MFVLNNNINFYIFIYPIERIAKKLIPVMVIL